MREIPPWYRDLLKQGLAQPGDLRPKVFPRHAYWEEFLRRMDGNFWKSPDIKVAEGTVIPAQTEQYVPVIIPPYPAMGIFEDLPRDALAFAQISTRSRYAQLGIEVPYNAIHELARRINFDSPLGENGFLSEVCVRNRSPHSIRIPGEAGLFKLYAESIPFVSDEQLLYLVENGEISIDGEKGEDWDFDMVTYEGYGDSITGIKLRLDPSKKLWLPPKRIWLPGETEERPIEIPEVSEVHYRELIDSYLEPAPASKTPMLWIGETVSRVKLALEVNAVMVAVEPEGMRHVNSLLIDGGTDWKIRTEIISPTALNFPIEIFLQFYT